VHTSIVPRRSHSFKFPSPSGNGFGACLRTRGERSAQTDHGASPRAGRLTCYSFYSLYCPAKMGTTRPGSVSHPDVWSKPHERYMPQD